MKVWIVNPFDNLPLEGNRPQRYWLMARAFVRAGHEVTLWTSDFSHSRKAKRRLVKTMEELESPVFRLVQVPTPAYRRNLGLRRILSHRAFAGRWRRLARREEAPALLVTSMPPLALGAAALQLVRAWRSEGRDEVRLVVDVQDAWPETFERVAPRWLLSPLRRTAGRVYRGADAVSGVAERYVELAKAYGAKSPMRVFRLGIELEAPERRVRTEPADVLRLVYIGNMGRSYDLATVVEAVKGMDDVELELAGSGPGEAELRERAGSCGRIRFHGYLGDRELRTLLAQGDAAVIPMFDSACVGVPGKLADYAAAELPVLNTLHGETERLLARYGAGYTYTAGAPAEFGAAVARLRAADRVRLREGARSLASEFDAKRVYGGFVEWAENLGRKDEGHA